eukprot:2962254-Pyramimonas_sp.AAC.1
MCIRDRVCPRPTPEEAAGPLADASADTNACANTAADANCSLEPSASASAGANCAGDKCH